MPILVIEELASFALTHALSSIERGGPLIPFSIVDTDGVRTIHRYASFTLEQGVAAGREHLRSLEGTDAAAFAWDAELPGLDAARPAIFVQLSHSDSTEHPVYAVAYETRGAFRKRTFQVGELAFVGQGEPLF